MRKEIQNAVRTERNYCRSCLGFVFFKEEGCREVGPVSVCFHFLLFQRLKASSGMNRRVKVKTN